MTFPCKGGVQMLLKLLPFLEDILIFAGCFVITVTTFYVNHIFGLYLLGAELMGFGILLAIAGRQKGGD